MKKDLKSNIATVLMKEPVDMRFEQRWTGPPKLWYYGYHIYGGLVYGFLCELRQGNRMDKQKRIL